MTIRSRWLIAACFLATTSMASAELAPVPPGTSPLAIVPASAPIVIQIRGVERTKARLATLLKNAVPDFGPLAVKKIDDSIAESLEGRKLQGIENDGPIFVVFLQLPTGEEDIPAAALVARVSKYADFRDGLLTEDERKTLKPAGDGAERTEIKGKEVFFVERNGWAIVTPHKDSVALFAKDNAGLNTKLSGEIAKKLTECDAAVYVNLAAVNKQFGEQIKEAKDTFFGLMDQFGGQDKATMEMAKTMYSGVFQVIEDGRAFVLGLDFRPEGLSLQVAAQIGADTSTNKFLSDQKPVSLKQIGGLPSGQMIYSATEFAPSLMKAMAPMLFGMAGDTDADGKAAVKNALDDMIAAGNSTSISAGRIPASTFQVQTFRDPAKAVAAQIQMFRAMSDGALFQSAAIKGKPELKENVESYRGFKFNYTKFVWDLDKLADQVPGGGDEIKKAMTKLMGEGMQIWFGSDGKQVITVSGKDWDEAKSQIDAFLDGKSPISGEAAFNATRGQLPADATMLSFADAGKFTMAMGEYVLAIFKAMPQLPFNLPQNMKQVETTTIFIGVAVVMKSEHGSFELFLPAKAVPEIRKVLMPLFMGGE